VAHRAETILETIKTNLTGLATTGANVARGRVWPVDALPALSIYKGSDEASVDEPPLDTLVRELDLSIHIHTSQTGNPETHLNAIAAEVFAALTADPTQGLGYVFTTELVADAEPEIVDSQDLPVGRMVSAWRIVYEHSKTDAEL
jgi:hypothetical protein